MVKFTGGVELFEERRKLIGHILVEQVKNFLPMMQTGSFMQKFFRVQLIQKV